MGKLLFFDVDGTLAIPGCPPSPATVSAIRAARKNGHKVFLSTGRTMGSVPVPVMDIGFDGGIFSAGGYTIAEGQMLTQHFIPKEMCKEICDRFHEHSDICIFETVDGQFVSENVKAVLDTCSVLKADKEMERFACELVASPDHAKMSDYRGQPVCKITFLSTDFHLPDRLSDALGGRIKVVRFDDLVQGFPMVAGEISDISVNKGVALQDICKFYHVQEKDCVAFGDSMNDAEILHVAGVGVAMGNAEERVRCLADMVCDSCENDGVAKTLLAMNLLSE